MLDVDIRNFQSIDHVHLRIDGFTALVGRSNIGKSAIIRAIKAALTGAPEDNYVRHSATCEKIVKGTKGCKCYCTVHLKSENFDVLWEKGGDRNEYQFNGQTYTAVSRGVPSFLEDQFGLVKIGDSKTLLQVADQFRSEGGGPIFLLDESGSVIADVLSDVANLDSINVASRFVEKDRKDCVAQRKVREKDVLDLKIKSLSYEGLDDVLSGVRAVESDELRVLTQRVKCNQIGQFKDSVASAGKTILSLRSALSVAPPEITPVVDQHGKLRKLANFTTSLRVRQEVIDSLTGVDAIPIPLFDPLKEKSARLGKLTTWLAKMRTYKEFFTRWKGLESVQTPEMGTLQQASKMTLHLSSLCQQLAIVTQQIGKLEQLLTAAEKEYQVLKSEEKELGVCPTCTQPLSLTHAHKEI